jgi:hypothetical protein
LIGEIAQSLDTNTFNRRPKNLKCSLDELASEIIAPQHYFKNQMKDTFLTELVGQSIVHHHVRDELGESKQNVGLVFVVVEQNQNSVNNFRVTDRPEMFGSLIQKNLNWTRLLNVIFLVLK